MLNENKYAKLKNDLESYFPKAIVLCDEPMSAHTTFKIGGPCDIYIEPATSEVVPLINLLRNQQVPFMVVGNGSNLLVSDEGIEGVVVSLGNNAGDITVEGEKIIADAGALLSRVANTALKESLSGMEFAAGIPGTIGGAVYMNAGAYGGQMKDIIEYATVLTSDYTFEEWSVDELDLSYRHSRVMEEQAIVINACLKLNKGDADAIRATMDDLKAKRVEKQPLNLPSAGSTFKRPEGFFAGKLIEDAGLRGYTVGGAQVSEKHCGFVVNKGNATCKDVLKLMEDVDKKVFELFTVHLEPEVRIVGRGLS